MAKQVQIRRGTTVEHGAFIGANGEITIDGDKDTIVVHDGSTAGGFPLARQDMSNVSNNIGLSQLDISNAGTPGQVLQKDNGETLSFVNLPDSAVFSIGGDLSGTIGDAQINPNTVGLSELNVSDSLAGDILTTNGNGVLFFTNPQTQIAISGEVNGTIGDVIISDDVISNAKMQVNSIGQNNIINNSINNDKIADLTITDEKIIGLTADKLIAGGTLPALKGPEITELPYDISFLAGFDSETIPSDLLEQVYGEMIMARSGKFDGEVGYIATTGAGQPIMMDVQKNEVSIYTTQPSFVSGTGSQNMTSGVLKNDNTFVSGDRLTFRVTQIGIGEGTFGQGLRFTLRCRV
jgi:hypothetical protein